MHAVDKVQVGQAGLAVHHRVSGGRPEARVRRLVRLADVGLDLNDSPSHPAKLGIVRDETGAKEAAGGSQGRPAQERPVERPEGPQVRG